MKVTIIKEKIDTGQWEYTIKFGKKIIGKKVFDGILTKSSEYNYIKKCFKKNKIKMSEWK